ncbi:MAG TPA: TolC family protein [Segetibacter sp.]
MSRAKEWLFSFSCVALLYGNNIIQLSRWLLDHRFKNQLFCKLLQYYKGFSYRFLLVLLYKSATQQCSTGVTSAGYQKQLIPKKFIFLWLFVTVTVANAQPRISFNAAYDTALLNNLQLRSADIQIQRSSALQNTWADIPKTGFFAENEDIAPGNNKGILKIGISQSIEWPSVYRARKNLLQEQAKSAGLTKQISALEIKRDLQTAYYSLWFLQSKQTLWKRLDSIYTSLAKAAVLRVKTGESAGLDSLSAMARARETSLQLNTLQREIQMEQEVFKRLLNTTTNYLPDTNTTGKIPVSFLDTGVNTHPQLQLQQQNIFIAGAEVNVQQQSRKPHLAGRFFSQRLYGLSNPFSGFSVSAGIPLFGLKSYKNKLKATELERDYQESLLNYQRQAISSGYSQLYQQIQKDQEMLQYYEGSGLAQADAIIKSSNLAYRGGEINFAELTQFITQATEIQKNYLDVLNQYNLSAIQLNYLIGN